MAQLTFSYDTTTKKFSAASVDGRPLDGVSRVTLGFFTVEVMDRKGRDLLAAGSETATPSPGQSSVEQDIAACFGAGGRARASVRDEPVDGFDCWDRARGAL